MTRTQYKKFIEKELEALNQKIDLKLMYGLGYNDDAKRHKVLLQQARVLRKRAFFGKLVSALSIF